MHREFVHHILEDEVDGQEERKDDKREDGEQREESGVVEESQNEHMRMTHDARTTNTRLEPRATHVRVSVRENTTCEVWCSQEKGFRGRLNEGPNPREKGQPPEANLQKEGPTPPKQKQIR